MREGKSVIFDLELLSKLADRMLSGNDGEALSGLHAVAGMFREKNISLKDAVLFAAKNSDMWASEKVDNAAKKEPVSVSADKGITHCQPSGVSAIEVFRPGHKESQVFELSGVAAMNLDDLCLHFKDALVAAQLNKSPFKIRLVDIKDEKGQVKETVMQAEYQKAGSAPVQIWRGTRGEAGALAITMRKAAAWVLPEYAG